jgi:hypothetical protein
MVTCMASDVEGRTIYWHLRVIYYQALSLTLVAGPSLQGKTDCAVGVVCAMNAGISAATCCRCQMHMLMLPADACCSWQAHPRSGAHALKKHCQPAPACCQSNGQLLLWVGWLIWRAVPPVAAAAARDRHKNYDQLVI